MTRIERTIRGYHCDAYGHVNNARYLEFLEEARWAHLQPAMDQASFDRLGLHFVVVRLCIDYKAPLVPNDRIQVVVKEQNFNNMSMSFVQEITKDDQLCARAEVSFVLLDARSQRPTPITDEIRAIFEDLMNHA